LIKLDRAIPIILAQLCRPQRDGRAGAKVEGQMQAPRQGRFAVSLAKASGSA
jgi:hypothetical protein